MGHGNGHHVFLPGALAEALLARRGRGGHGPEGGGAGTLDAGVHIGFVVPADVGEVVAPFQGPGEGLEADVAGGAVAAHGHHLGHGAFKFALAFQDTQGGFDAGSHRRGVFEGHVNPGMHPGGLGHARGDDLHTAGGVSNDGVFADGLTGPPHGQGFAAALAGPVARGE